jgi:hypothetical protein
VEAWSHHTDDWDSWTMTAAWHELRKLDKTPPDWKINLHLVQMTHWHVTWSGGLCHGPTSGSQAMLNWTKFQQNFPWLLCVHTSCSPWRWTPLLSGCPATSFSPPSPRLFSAEYRQCLLSKWHGITALLNFLKSYIWKSNGGAYDQSMLHASVEVFCWNPPLCTI